MTTSPMTITTLSEAEYRQHRVPEDLATFGTLQTEAGCLPLVAMELDGEVTGLLYRLKLRQRFHNTYAQPLEATYIFPLPGRAAVSSFVMQTRERRVVGVLRERGEARRQYQEAIAAGKQAALAEEERSEVFTLTVGNIPPGESVEIEIELDGPLTWADGQAMFRFPLVVAPRYMPGRPYGGDDVGTGTQSDTPRVPDASRISPPLLLPGYPNPVRLSVDLHVRPGGLRFGAPRVSMPDLACSEAAGALRIQLKPLADRLDRDLILRFPLPSAEIQSAFQVQSSGEEHFWTLDLVPDDAHQQGPAVPRQVVALLDRSGSMSGWKMVCARRAVGRLIDSLVDADAFQVLTFDDRVEPLDAKKPGLRPASDRERFLAVEQLGNVEERGGTEILAALQAGVAALEGQRDPYLLLITDGQVGNESEVLRWVQQSARGVRIFPVGIDQAVNAGLLEQIARVTGGVFTLVESEQALDEAMSGLRRRINRPLLTDVRVELPGADQGVVGPRELFVGACTRLFGRTAGEVPAAVEVTGVAADGKAFRRQVPVAKAEGGSIAKMWARARVLELEHGFLAGWSDPSCQPAAIAAFALQHGVLCRFTAFVAIDEVKRVTGPQHHVTQAVSLPHGWEMAVDEAQFEEMASEGAALCDTALSAGSTASHEVQASSLDEPQFLRSSTHRGFAGAPPKPSNRAKAAPRNAPAPGGPNGKASKRDAGPSPVQGFVDKVRQALTPPPPASPAAPAPAAAPPPKPADAVQLALDALRRAATPGELEAALQALAEAVARASGLDVKEVRARLDGAWQAAQTGSLSRDAFLAEVDRLVQELLLQPPGRRDDFWLR